jgi:ABC-type nitrate/sulfonate/bicarbonate transport system permease component
MRLRKEPFISALVLIGLWELAALFFPPFLFPSMVAIGKQLVSILTDKNQIGGALATALRILIGMAGAFIFGTIIAVWMGMSARCERYVHPLLTFNQGIPALSWVVISIIWFKSTEFRIWFIIVMTTLPAFAFQIYDAYRAMSKDLVEMSLSFRPSKWDKLRASLSWQSLSAPRSVSVMNCCNASNYSTWPALSHGPWCWCCSSLFPKVS